MSNGVNLIDYKLTEREAKLIQRLREIAFGKVLIHQEAGQPVRIEEIRENIKL